MIMRLEKFDTSKNYSGLKHFDCNNEMINNFVKKSLKKRLKRGLSQGYILLDGDRVVGFYTLDSFAITRDSFEGDERPAGLPPMVPVVKLGMLGVDKHYQKRGIGKRLLRDALVKVVNISEMIGCIGIYLLAESEAVDFYRKLGFIVLNGTKPTPMFLHIETIKTLVI